MVAEAFLVDEDAMTETAEFTFSAHGLVLSLKSLTQIPCAASSRLSTSGMSHSLGLLPRRHRTDCISNFTSKSLRSLAGRLLPWLFNSFSINSNLQTWLKSWGPSDFLISAGEMSFSCPMYMVLMTEWRHTLNCWAVLQSCCKLSHTAVPRVRPGFPWTRTYSSVSCIQRKSAPPPCFIANPHLSWTWKEIII